MHDIYTVDGVSAFASAKEHAWHRLGQVLPGAMTTEEAIREAHLDYQVGLTPAQATIGEDLVDVPKKFVTYNEDTGVPFGVVGGRYTIVQNTDAFGFFDSIVGQEQAIIETAGALGDGETIFITAKLPNYLRINNSDDLIKNYLLLTMSHNGKGSIQAMLTQQRVVCSNTLAMAKSNCTNKISIRHTATAIDKLSQASELMNITFAAQAYTQEAFNAMAKKEVSDREVAVLIDKLTMTDKEFRLVHKDKATRNDVISGKKENIINAISKYTFEDETQLLDTTRGTVWGFYNGITGYYQNVKSYRSDESKFRSNLLGSNYDNMAKAYDLAESLLV